MLEAKTTTKACSIKGVFPSFSLQGLLEIVTCLEEGHQIWGDPHPLEHYSRNG
jgi:hypothetical protein